LKLKFKLNNVEASKILADVPPENAFYFYTGIGSYTGKYATNLLQFYEILKNIDVKSLEFHVEREDFENWLRFLGDIVLSLQIARIRKKRYMGENLRAKICEVVKNRYEKLSNLSKT
jgi:hypothetical protein